MDPITTLPTEITVQTNDSTDIIVEESVTAPPTSDSWRINEQRMGITSVLAAAVFVAVAL